jgi:hypothetical protein
MCKEKEPEAGFEGELRRAIDDDVCGNGQERIPTRKAVMVVK